MADIIGLQMDNAQLSLAPGENAVVRLNLINSGDVVDAFTITVIGLDPSWYTLSASEVKLFPRDQSAVTLEIHPPQTGTRPLAGFYPFTVMALSRDNPTIQTTIQGMVNLSAVGGLALDLQPRTISGRQGLYAITLSNAGNAPRTTVLALSDPEEALQFTLGTPSIREGEVVQADVFAAPTASGYTNSSYVTPPAFGGVTAKGNGVLEHEIELPASSTVVIPIRVKPLKRVWTGKERPFPFNAGAHPPGVEWEASEAQVVQGQLAYRPIFAAWVGLPLVARRALLLLIPLLILACLLFLLLRPQDKPALSAAAQTATAQALSLSQTMTAIAQANGGNVAGANATLTALAQSASAAQTAQAAANMTATAIAQGGESAGAAIIDRFYLKLGDPNATATPIGGGIAGSETSLQYNVSGASTVRINQSSHPFQAAGLQNASVIDFRMVATGTNLLPVTRTLSVLVVRPPMITSFDGAPLTISPGDSTSLLWQVLGAQDVTIDGIPVSTTGADGNGQISVQPTGSRRFIMCASNPVGTVCKSVVVTVLPPGAPTPTPIPPTRVPTQRPPTRVPTAAPTTAVPIVTATACTEEYSVTEEVEATVVPGLAPVAGSQCDDCSSTVMLPFPFQLYDRVFDRVSVGSNGTLNFASTTNPASANACLPAATSFDYAIFPHWDNLTTTGANRGIFTRVDGDAPDRIFIIEWRAAYVVANAPSGTANFEVRFFENAPDQRFEVIYGALTQGGSSATIGVQRDTGSHRTQYSCNTSNKVSQGLKLIFTLPCGGSGIGDRPSTCAPGDITVNIVDGKFSPRNLIVIQGSIITWVNLDSASHNTIGPSGLWASGTLAQGQTFKTTINTTGVYYYSSTLDQNLTGNITVLVACTPTPSPSPPNTATNTPVSTNTGTSTRTPTSTVTGTPPTSTTTGTATVTGTLPTSTPTITGTPPTNTATGTPTKPLGTTTITATPSGPGGGPCAPIESITGSITTFDPTQVGRVGLYDRPSTCALGDSCISPPDAMPRHYDLYTFTNNDSVARCITVQVNGEDCGGAGVMSAAYLGGFNPNNVCLNFLAQGGPPSNLYVYSFIVPAGATYFVVVHEYAPNEGCGEYSIDVAACISSTPTPVASPTSPPPPDPTNPPPPFASNTPRASATRTNTRAPSATPTNTLAPPTATSTATACAQPIVFQGAIVPGDPTQDGRIVRDDPQSTCALPQTCTITPGAFLYDSYSLTNSSASPVCVSITLDLNNCTAATIHSAVYLGSFNPNYACMNYLGDVGISPAGPAKTYSVTIPAGATFVIVVNGPASGGCSNYIITVNGLPGSCATSTPTPPSATSTNTVVTATASSTAIASATPTVTVTSTSTASATATAQATATAASCGPDANYQLGAGLVGYIDTNTQVLGPCANSDCGITITLPFPVRIYDINATTAAIGDNGIVVMSGTNPNPPASICLPANLQYALLPWWTNQNLSGSGLGVFTTVVGSSPDRTFVIEWRTNMGQFQVQLPETPSGFSYSQFGYAYATLLNPSQFTVGVQKNGVLYTQQVCDGANPDNVLYFQPSCVTPTPTTTATSTATSTSTATPPAACAWATVAPYPTQIMDNGVAAVGSSLYSFGGSINTQVFDASYVYSSATNTWTAIADLPSPRTGAGVVSDGTTIYIVNGSDTVSGDLNSLFSYDPVADSYTSLSVSPHDTIFQAAAYLDGIIYRISGLSGSSPSATVDQYDISSDTWSAAAPLPQAVSFPMAAAFNGYVYVAGGLNGATESLKTYRYDPATDTWDDLAVADLPATRYGSVSGVINGTWILAGGWSNSAITSTAISYDLFTNTWITTIVPNMSLARARMGSGVAGSTLYSVGGQATNSSVGSPDVQRFRFEPCAPVLPVAPPTSTPTNTAGPFPSVGPDPGGGGSEPTASTTPEPSASCRQWIRDDGPWTFSSDGTIESELDIPLEGVIDSLSVSNLSVTKEGAGKLNGYLVSPGGAQVELFHSVCRDPDSDEPFRWLNISLSDGGTREIQSVYCQDVVRGGIFRPDISSSNDSSDDAILGELRGTTAAGTWKLVLKADVQEVDSVRLDSWGLNICAIGSTMPANRAISSTQGAQSRGIDLVLAIVAIALATVGAPLAWARTRGVMFVDDRR
ncbi:MAG TPA: kelch repeat-containing protein [Chloroflexia bacterium]|nr:kelch repeat-containing protein [Chloroflexia bacterium]